MKQTAIEGQSGRLISVAIFEKSETKLFPLPVHIRNRIFVFSFKIEVRAERSGFFISISSAKKKSSAIRTNDIITIFDNGF